MSGELFERHRAMLEIVLRALATRNAFSAYAADPADYNEILAAEGRAAFTVNLFSTASGEKFTGNGPLLCTENQALAARTTLS